MPKNSFDEKKRDKIAWLNKITKNISIIDEDDLPLILQRRFFAYDEDNKKVYISQLFPKKVLFDAKEMEKYVDEIKSIKGKQKNYHPTGMHVLYVFLIKTVLHESRIFLSVVLVIIWLLLLIDFKNVKDSFIAMIPIIFGVLWLIEIMSIFDVKFNFMNIVVLPSVLGTGVDNGIHIYHRYRECKNILFALKKTGLANLGMSLTVALGWSALFFAHYEGLKTMAFVGVVGIIMTFIASVTIMPAVILLVDRKKQKKVS